jgi:hypothetical protein
VYKKAFRTAAGVTCERREGRAAAAAPVSAGAALGYSDA